MEFRVCWITKEKYEFRIIAMLADCGKFRGNASDICRYFLLNPQSKTKKAIRKAIKRLTSDGAIKCERTKNTYTMELFPKDNEKSVEIEKEWYEAIKNHQYASKSVAWENVLKVLIWLIANKDEEFINSIIASEINVDESTISSALTVLEKDFNALLRKKNYFLKGLKSDGSELYFVKSQEAIVKAWWDDEK